MKEIWKDVTGYENIYQISNIGNIKNVKSNKHRIACLHKSGYLIVSLHKNGKVKSFRVHRLVAEAFLEKNNQEDVVNHINGNKIDNRVENLEWCSQKENVNKAIQQGLFEHNYLNKKIAKCDKNGKILEVYNSIKEASEKNNIHRNCIYACLKKITKTCLKQKWFYI